MDFLRQLNKNVQQSFSILNEGILITNGILDIKNNYLPYLLQLSPLESIKHARNRRCCLFDEYNKHWDSTDVDPLSPTHFHDSTPKSSFSGQERSLDGNNAIAVGEDVGDSTFVDAKVCVLKENCLLKKISSEKYNEGIEFISKFLNTLQGVLDHSTAASRGLIETQAIPLLYDISSLTPALKFIKDCGSRLDTVFENTIDVYKSLLPIIISSLKQLNSIVKYPSSLLLLRQKDAEYDDCRTEELKYDSVLRNLDVDNHYTAFDLVGSLTIIHMDDLEKHDLDKFLSLVDSITQFSSNSKLIFHSLHLCFEDRDPSCNELIYELLALLQKLFTYNDINWHISQNNINILYLRDKLEHYSCNFYLCHNGECYGCSKPMKLPGRENFTNNTSFCSCFCAGFMENSINSKLTEEVVRYDGTNIKLLLDIVKDIKESYIKAKAIELLLQFVIHIDSCEQYFYANDGLDVILNILDGCYTDQFYLWNSSFNETENHEKRLDKNIIIDENDIRIIMIFAPCTVESLLLIHHLVKQIAWPPGTNTTEYIVKYTEALLQVFTFHKCSFETVESESIFSQVLYVVLDTCIWLLTPCSPGMILNDESSTINKIYRVNETFRLDSDDVWKVMGRGLLQLSIFSLVILLNNTKFGNDLDYTIFYKLSSYLTILFWASNSLYTSYDENGILSKLLHPISSKYPSYKHLLLKLYKRESNCPTTASESLVILHELRLGALENAETSAIIHLTICLLDDISFYIPDFLRQCILDSCAALRIFESTLSIKFCRYISLICNDFLIALENGSKFYDEKALVPYRCFITIYVDILISLFLRNETECSNIKFIGDRPSDLISRALRLIVNIAPTNYNSVLESFLLSFLKFLFLYTLSWKEALTFDHTPLLDLVSVDKTNLALSNGLSSIILSLLIAKGSIEINKEISLLIPKLAKNINILYSSQELKLAESLLMEIDIIMPIDSLSLEFEDTYNRFLKEAESTDISNVLSLLFWYRNNYFGFSFSPHIYKCITLFRLYLHPHVFDIITRKFITDHFFNSVPLQDSEIQTISALKSMQMKEMEFAHNKISQLESQLKVLSNFHHLSDLNFRQLNDRINFLEEENKILRVNIDNTTDGHLRDNIALRIQLADNILRYKKLEDKHNKLLKYLGSLSNKENASKHNL